MLLFSCCKDTNFSRTAKIFFILMAKFSSSSAYYVITFLRNVCYSKDISIGRFQREVGLHIPTREIAITYNP